VSACVRRSARALPAVIRQPREDVIDAIMQVIRARRHG